MSSSTENEQSAPTAESMITDDSRIVDETRFAAAKEKLLQCAKSAVAATNRFTNAAKGLAAARVEIRSLIITKGEFPDWGALSDQYRVAVSVSENEVLAPLDAASKRRLQDAVRQHVARTYLLRGVVTHIVTNEPNFADERAMVESGDIEKLIGDPPNALKTRVRQHYRSASLKVPTEYEVGTPAPETPDATPENAVTALMSALEGLGKVVPHYATLGILRTTSDVSRVLTSGKTSDVENRPIVVDHLKRIATIALLTAKHLESKSDSADREKLDAAYFDTTKDTSPAK